MGYIGGRCKEKHSLDGDPNWLTPTLGLDDLLLQAVNPEAAIEHFADLTVLANEDAAFHPFILYTFRTTPAYRRSFGTSVL